MNRIQKEIIRFIDFFHRPFKKIVSELTFRYAFCGGLNTLFDVLLYHVIYTYVLKGRIIDLTIVAISGHISSFLIVFPITFMSGFLLAKYITFSQSEIRGRIQLVRYALVVTGSIILNYLFLKLFVELFGFYPTLSKVFTTVFVVTYSYFAQKHYTFKI